MIIDKNEKIIFLIVILQFQFAELIYGVWLLRNSYLDAYYRSRFILICMIINKPKLTCNFFLDQRQIIH